MFLLSLMLVLFSCEQENTLSEISTDNNENEVPLTRNSSDLTRPIEQLDGIPVNIKSVYSKKYLSVVSDNGKLVVSGKGGMLKCLMPRSFLLKYLHCIDSTILILL